MREVDDAGGYYFAGAAPGGETVDYHDAGLGEGGAVVGHAAHPGLVGGFWLEEGGRWCGGGMEMEWMGDVVGVRLEGEG